MKLLVVDDDVHIRRILAIYLREHAVVEAATGEEALAKAQAERFDAAIVDLILPPFGGLRVCRHLKEANTRVIVISGDEALREQAKEAGADGFVAKPFTKEELVAGLLGRSVAGSAPEEPSNPATQ
jgi:DNA-binding response OmpR family regulator